MPWLRTDPLRNQVPPGITHSRVNCIKPKKAGWQTWRQGSKYRLFGRWFRETQVGRREEKEANPRCYSPLSTMATGAPPPEGSESQSRLWLQASTWGAKELERCLWGHWLLSCPVLPCGWVECPPMARNEAAFAHRGEAEGLWVGQGAPSATPVQQRQYESRLNSGQRALLGIRREMT